MRSAKYQKSILILAIIAGFTLFAQEVAAPLNPQLKPTEVDVDEELFKDMVVVQKKAMNKSGRFLLSSYASLDFSDGPYTMWSWNINPGYALSDFWEIYLSVAPVFINQERDIVQKVESIGGTIQAAKAKYQYGAEILWSPLYGKDSLGSRNIIRSDTFVKLGVHNIVYDQGDGLKLHVALGKTYFLTKYLGFRPAISGNYIETIIDREKEFRFFAIVEAGLVGYF